MMKIQRFAWCVVLMSMMVSAMAASKTRPVAADSKSSSAEKQRKYIGVLQSDAPPKDKAMACKQLAIYGTKDAVPALAPLLADESLASWARIALEAIPDATADEALRRAMDKLQGRLLIGTINSIGVRRDPKAVDGLVNKLKDADAEVASAAAVALGHIGGGQVPKALMPLLSSAPDKVRPAVAEGCILCAERFLTEGKHGPAAILYDSVRQANVPKQARLEAIRGAILARRSSGIGLLIEQLRSVDKAFLAIGLRTARELPGRNVTEALAAELNRTSPDRQGLLLLALADRTDSAVLPAIVGAAKNGPKQLQIVAIGLLGRLGNVSCVTLLLNAASGSDAELARPAKVALAELPDKKVDADLLGRLPKSEGKMRQVLIELAGQRQVNGALPAVGRYVEDADAGVRAAAVQALGALGEDKEVAELVRLLQKAQSADDRANVEKALLVISGRRGASCVQYLLPLTQSNDSGLRITGLHALASVGGPQALAAVKAAIEDKDEAVRDEAVRTLSTWPNNWPEDASVAEPLLALAKSGKKPSYQVLALRGYLEYVQGDKKLKDDDKVMKINDLLPLMKRPEEKRLAIGAIGSIRTAGTLELLVTFAADAALAEEACSAIVKLSGRNIPRTSKAQRQKALQTVVEKSNNDATKKKAEELLKGI